MKFCTFVPRVRQKRTSLTAYLVWVAGYTAGRRTVGATERSVCGQGCGRERAGATEEEEEECLRQWRRGADFPFEPMGPGDALLMTYDGRKMAVS